MWEALGNFKRWRPPASLENTVMSDLKDLRCGTEESGMLSRVERKKRVCNPLEM